MKDCFLLSWIDVCFFSPLLLLFSVLFTSSAFDCLSAMDYTSSGTSQLRLQLWQFLLELLSRPESFGSVIKWTDPTGEFKVLETEELARLWGGRKGRNNMNYDKLSRSLRYYYDKGILQKVPGQRLVYRFDTAIYRRHEEQLRNGLSGVVSLPFAASSTSGTSVAKRPPRDAVPASPDASGELKPRVYPGI